LMLMHVFIHEITSELAHSVKVRPSSMPNY
jgi:hypothetical protein